MKKMFWKNKKSLLALLLPALLILSSGMFQGTFGKFSHSFTATDSALAAKFDVIITPPEEFNAEGFKHHFLSDSEVKGLHFRVYNNGETDVLCAPYITNGVKYRVFILGIEQTEFILKTKETINFQLLIAPDGLDGKLKDAELFIDIKQPERS